MTLALTGTGVMSGVAVGPAHLLIRSELEIQEYQVPDDAREQEVERFQSALGEARRHLQALADRLRRTAGSGAEEIIRTHLHMLDDAVIADDTESTILEQGCNAEWALQMQLEHIVAEFRSLDDEYIRSREEDVIQVVRLLQRTLSEAAEAGDAHESSLKLNGTIVVARELTPGDVALLSEQEVAGLVVARGSAHSHSAILARSLRLPMIVGIPSALRILQENEPLILDGHYGAVFATDDETIQRHYHQKQRKSRRYRLSLDQYREHDCITRDGIKVELQANAERGDEIAEALNCGIQAVGLYRSEFLFTQDQLPDEETQYGYYRKAVEHAGGKPVTIRTLDLGADKAWGPARQLISGSNPALGLRALRLCLRQPEMFREQLRAILRASADGPVRVLIPMLTHPAEMQSVRRILAQCREELDKRGQAYDSNLPVGGMIEVPAAAMAIDHFSESLDFLSLGTNDLIQYLLAADRVDDQVAHLYNPLHPAVIRLLGDALQSAAECGVPMAVCGELAGDARYTRLLLALGLRVFSMHPSYLLEVKRTIIETDVSVARQHLDSLPEQPDNLSPEQWLARLNGKLH